MAHQTVRISFECVPHDIIYVNGVLDSYGNLGLMRTVDKSGYNCAVFTTEDLYETVITILRELIKEGAGISAIKTDITENVDIA